MEKGTHRKLTEEEERVIIHKGTEAPFSGAYNNFSRSGSYHCKQCNALLYRSEDKFTSACGWPSFDDEVAGAIRRQTDADGRRTEILCENCGAHLGHVFEGERITVKNTRHCVNSISLVFVPDDDAPQVSKAYFAGGCFWGVEYYFEHREGVISAVSGYMGGTLKNPSYRDVCYGDTGHYEVVQVTYDACRVSYESLAKLFFEVHDPTQTDGQGPDIGAQYLSAVFYNDENERRTIQQLIDILKSKGHDVRTELIPASTFWEAEEYHQDYYERNGKRPYCHAYERKF